MERAAVLGKRRLNIGLDRKVILADADRGRAAGDSWRRRGRRV